MAMEELQGVIQALVAGHQRDIERQRLQQSAAYQQSEIEDRAEQRKLQAQQYAVQAKREALQEKAQMNINELARFQMQQNVGQGYTNNEQLPPDATIEDLPGSTTHKVIKWKIGDQNYSTTALDPTVASQHKAARTATEKAPEWQHDLEKEAQKAADADKRAADNKAADAARAAANQAAQDARNDANIISREKLADLRNAALAKNLKPHMSEEDIKADVANAISGKLTREEALASYKGDFPLLQHAMTASGSNFYTKPQKELPGKVAGLLLVKDSLNRAQQILEKGMPIPGSDDFAELYKIQSQVGEKLVSGLGVLGQGSRLSDPRVKLVKDAFGPSFWFNAKKNNEIAIKNYMPFLADTVKGIYHGLSPHQLDAQMAELGLLGEDSESQKKKAGGTSKPGVTHRFNPKTGIAEPVQQD